MLIPNKLLIGFLLTFLTVATLGLLSYHYMNDVIEIGQQNSFTKKTLRVSQEARTTLIDVNRNALGYHATHQTYFIDHARSRSKVLARQMEELNSLTAPVPTFKTTLDDLNKGVEEFLNLTHRATKKPGEDTLTNDSLLSEQMQHTLEETNLVFKTLEEQIVSYERTQQETLTKKFYRFLIMFSVLLLMGLLFIPGLLYVTNLTFKARSEDQKRLIERNAPIEYLYENAPCGYLTVNSEGMVTNINQTLLSWLGYHKNEVTDRMHVSGLIPTWKQLVDRWENFEKYEKVPEENPEPEVLTKNKESIPSLISASPVPDANAGRGYNLTLVDYSDRKKMKEQLQQTNKDLESFGYSISHDLRAPLRAIGSYSAVLKEDYGHKMDHEAHRLLDIIVKNVKNMGDLIEDLLRLSKTGRQEVVKMEVAMNMLVDRVVKELEAQQGLNKASFKIKPLGYAMADTGLIKQVWVNLLSNALKYSQLSETPEIEVGFYKGESEKVYYVKDNGVGFDMKYYDKLFGVFQRLHTKKDFEGTGVGLSLVKRIIENHRGRIWVEAEVNQGATFFFTLPES